MTSPTIQSPPDQQTAKYWVHFVPEVGDPWFLPFDTADQVLHAVGDGNSTAGWFTVFHGYHMPLTADRFRLLLNSPFGSVVAELPPGANAMRVEPVSTGGSLFVQPGYTASISADVPRQDISNRNVEV